MEHAPNPRDGRDDCGDNRSPLHDHYRDHDLTVSPSDFDLSDDVGFAIYEFYVVEHTPLRDAVRKARKRTGETIDDGAASKFVRANGWMRSQRYYAQRSKFKDLNEANFAETRARREGRL